MTSMSERMERAKERLAEMRKHVPEGVDERLWIREQLGLEDFDVPDNPDGHPSKEAP